LQHARVEPRPAGTQLLIDALEVSADKRFPDLFARNGVGSDLNYNFIADLKPAPQLQPRPIEVFKCDVFAGRTRRDWMPFRLQLAYTLNSIKAEGALDAAVKPCVRLFVAVESRRAQPRFPNGELRHTAAGTVELKNTTVHSRPSGLATEEEIGYRLQHQSSFTTMRNV